MLPKIGTTLFLSRNPYNGLVFNHYQPLTDMSQLVSGSTQRVHISGHYGIYMVIYEHWAWFVGIRLSKEASRETEYGD